jgi:photosystem II stability/assembly factor-like uncharacterized protein
MNIESLLRDADPALAASIPEPDLRVARTISNLDNLNGTASDLDATHSVTLRRPARTPVLRTQKPLLLVALAILVIAAIIVPLTFDHSTPPQTNTTPTVHVPSRPAWSFVGYITRPGWKTSSASGPLPTSQQSTIQLVCPTSATCYSSGTDVPNGFKKTQSVISVTHNGGTSWRLSLAPGHGIYFYGFSCTTASTCMVVGDEPSTRKHPSLYATTDGGARWTSHPIPGPNEMPVVLSCATTLKCVTMGQYETRTAPVPISYFTDDGGRHWTKSALPSSFFPSELSSLDCFSDGRCVAEGSEGFGRTGGGLASMIYSNDDGESWKAARTSPTPANGGTMSCSSDLHCLSIESGKRGDKFPTAVGELETNDGGMTWTTVPVTGLTSPSPSRPMYIDALSCPSASDCWAAAHVYPNVCQGSCSPAPVTAVMLATSDGGLTWTREALPSSPRTSLQYVDVSPLYCLSVTDCRAVGTLEPTKAAMKSGLPWVEQDVVLTLRGIPPSSASIS